MPLDHGRGLPVPDEVCIPEPLLVHAAHHRAHLVDDVERALVVPSGKLGHGAVQMHRADPVVDRTTFSTVARVPVQPVVPGHIIEPLAASASPSCVSTRATTKSTTRRSTTARPRGFNSRSLAREPGVR